MYDVDVVVVLLRVKVNIVENVFPRLYHLYFTVLGLIKIFKIILCRSTVIKLQKKNSPEVVSRLPALCHKIEVNLKSLSFLRNKS